MSEPRELYKIHIIDLEPYKIFIHYGKTREFDKYYEVWLQKKNYGVAMLMFGLTNIELWEAIDISASNFEQYKLIYIDEYEWEEEENVQLSKNSK